MTSFVALAKSEERSNDYISNKTQNTLSTSFKGLDDKCLGELNDPGLRSAEGKIDDIVDKTMKMLKNIARL